MKRRFEWRHLDYYARDDDWEEVQAFDAWEAVKLGADRWDQEERHMLRGGESHIFEVRDDEGVVTRWTVWGEAVPHYYATPAP